MKISIIILSGLILFLSGCKKVETIKFQSEGTLTGQVVTFNEFGMGNSDYGNVLVQVDGTYPLITAYTNDSGNFEIDHLPAGTYDLIFSKDGYNSMIIMGYRFAGGIAPENINYIRMFEKSSTRIENFSIEVKEGEGINFKGTIFHNFNFDSLETLYVPVRFYITDKSNPSRYEYIQNMEFFFEGESGQQFETGYYHYNTSLFSPHSTIYAVAYGSSDFMLGETCASFGYYDYLNDVEVCTNLGEPSNIASFTLE